MKKAGIALLTMVLLVVMTSCKSENGAATQTGNASYTIVKTNTDPDWDSVAVMQINNVLWTGDTGIRAQGQLCYSDDYLFVHLRAVEQEIRAENTEPLSPVYEDSCLEFFFKLPDADNYFNFEINPNGCLLAQFGPKITDRISITRPDTAEYFDIRTNITSDGWEVFYKIPLKFIRFFYPDYSFEGKLSANMYKCGDKTVNQHYLSWAPINLESPNFHCPEYFGGLSFAG